MPTLPRKNPPARLNIPMVSEQGLEPVFRAGRETVRGMTQAAASVEKAIVGYFEKEKKMGQKVKAMQMEHGLRNDMMDFAETYRDRLDFDNFESDAVNTWEGFRTKYMEMAGSDPDLGIAFENHINDQQDKFMQMVRDKKWKVMGDIGKGEFNMEYNRLANEYITMPREQGATREIIKLELESKAMSLVPGIFTLPEAQAQINAWNKSAEEGRLIELYHKDPPSAILAIEKNEFPSLNPRELSVYKIAAQTMAKTLAKQKEAEEKETRLTDALTFLKEAHGFFSKNYDYEMMLNKLRSIDFQKEWKLTAQDAHQAEIILTSEMQTIYDSIQQNFLKKLQEGTLTEREVMQSSLPATGLAQGDKNWWLEKLEKKRVSPDAFLHSNPRVYSETIVDVIKNPEKWDKDKIFSLVGLADKEGKPTGLKADDAIRIWGIHTQITKPDPVLAKKFTALQQVLERMESYRKAFFFITPDKEGVVTSKESVQNDQLHYSAQQDLLNRVDEGEEPFTVLAEIMQKYTQEKAKGYWDRVLNWVLPSAPPPPEEAKYGLRVDRTQKGPGFLGEIKTPKGKVSTEISIGVNIDGKETLIPSLVPTLSKDEINHLVGGGKPTKEIIDKAVEHAKKRISEGKSPFKEWEETKPQSLPPEEKEGRYDVNGTIWNWTKAKGWYR